MTGIRGPALPTWLVKVNESLDLVRGKSHYRDRAVEKLSLAFKEYTDGYRIEQEYNEAKSKAEDEAKSKAVDEDLLAEARWIAADVNDKRLAGGNAHLSFRTAIRTEYIGGKKDDSAGVAAALAALKKERGKK